MITLSEREFIISLAINRYNAQYNKSLKLADCDARSIEPSDGFRLGYEIITVRFNDFVRLHLYLNFADYDHISPYTLEVNYPSRTDSLGDEVFVSIGDIDRYYISNNIYQFRNLAFDENRLHILLVEKGEPLYTEDGEYILLEEGE